MESWLEKGYKMESNTAWLKKEITKKKDLPVTEEELQAHVFDLQPATPLKVTQQSYKHGSAVNPLSKEVKLSSVFYT